jgi:hypothetical protein
MHEVRALVEVPLMMWAEIQRPDTAATAPRVVDGLAFPLWICGRSRGCRSPPFGELLERPDAVVQDRFVDVVARHAPARLLAVRQGVLDPQDRCAGLGSQARWQRLQVGEVGLAFWLVNEPDIEVPILPPS